MWRRIKLHHITLNTNKTLETAAKIFTYLNLCPPKKLISFYEDLFNTASAKNMTLALLSILKTSKNAVKQSSAKIYKETIKAVRGFKNTSIDSGLKWINECNMHVKLQFQNLFTKSEIFGQNIPIYGFTSGLELRGE